MSFFDKLFNRFHVDPALERAVQKEWQGDLESAIGELTSAIAVSEPTAARLSALAVLLMKAGRNAEAADSSAKALALAPNQPELIVTHSRILRRSGRFEEALPLISDLYHREKKNIFVATEYCKLLVDMGRRDEAAAIMFETSGWFKPLVNKPRMVQSGMSRAYREAKAKLEQAAKS